MTRLVAFLIITGQVVGLGLGGTKAVAQETPGAAEEVLAQFGGARALAVDPQGKIYVADAAQDAVSVLDSEGRQGMRLGGSGARAGEFDTPSDVDPTNGQLILVADTYNGRVQRFSEEGQYLESLPIGRLDRSGREGWSFQDGRDGEAMRGDGRPIAVAQDDDGTLFVLDARTRQLVSWNDVGRSGRIDETGKKRLQDPVALAVGNHRLYVADAGQEAVLVYDTFGTFLRQLSLPSLPTLRALAIHRGRLYVVCAQRVLVWSPQEGLAAEHPVGLSEPLVDLAFYRDRTYMLTSTRLFRRPLW